MNDLEQILDYLRTLEERGWPVNVYPASIREFEPDEEFLIRGFIEREIETRGLWEEYMKHVHMNSRSHRFFGWEVPWTRRPTLLEVLQAAVEVTNAC